MTTVLSLGLLATPTAAFAAGATSAPSESASQKPTSITKLHNITPPVLTGTAKAIWDARVKAKASGKAVTVDELTTEATETVVNPDGTLTSKSFAQAVRVKKGKNWSAIDATLRANHDGTLSPAATPEGLTFSGGGQGPLATLTTDDGKKLAISAPFALPKPTVSGDTATYSSVLPDVDLQISALPTGGWRDVIVVHTAAAAANPALKKLHFPISTQGLNVASDKAGNIQLKDAKGEVRFSAPTPFQWDSTRAPVAKPSHVRSAFAMADTLVDDTAAASSSAKAPGDGAKLGVMSAAADANGIDLTPDPATFGKGSGPWYLDPTVSANAASQQSAQVQEYYPDTQYADKVSSLGTGYCAWLTGSDPCPALGRARAYYRVGIPSAIYTQPGGAPSPPTIHDATLQTTATTASNGSQNTPMGVFWTGPISGTTTWHNQPCGQDSGLMSGCSQVSGTWFTGTGGVNFDLTSTMQQAAAGHWPDWTFALAPTDETNGNYRHHFANNPNIVINYDLQPSTWWPRATPTPGFASNSGSYNDCQTPGTTHAWDNPGWIGANQNITLHSSSWSPSGFGLDNYIHIWDDNNSSWGEQLDTGTLGAYNGDAAINVGSLTDGHQYGWNAWSNDGWLTSPATGWCYFRVDKTPPTVSITSTDFPATGTLNATPKVYAGSSGQFTLSGFDPVPPSGGAASGIACIRWSDNPTPPTGWKCGDSTSGNTGIVQGGSGTFSYTPPNWGTNVVYAQGMDNAGNYSQPMSYSFYAPWNPATKSLPGSLTLDGRPDVLMTDAAGNLRIEHIGNNPTSMQAAPVGLSPADPTSGVQPTWTGVLTSHRGSLSANALDDVFAYSTATPTLAQNLYVYPNTANGAFQTAAPLMKSNIGSWYDNTGKSLPQAPADWQGDWSKTSQILALGALNATFSTDPTWVKSGAASLLSVENGNLWLYRSEGTNTLDDAIEVSNTGNWGNYELLNPGSAGGTSQPTLWTRNKTDGSIRSYQVKVTNNSLDLSALTNPTNGTVFPYITLKVSDYPTIGAADGLTTAPGKLGIPGLWALNSNQQFIDWQGVTSDGTTNTAVTGFTFPTMVADLRGATDSVPLSSISNGTTPDTAGTHPGTVKGGVTIGTDTVAGNSTSVAQFDGNNGTEVDVNGLQVDTTKSFTISTWTKANKTDGVVFSQDNSQASGFMLWPATFGDGTVNWHFGMATADNGGWPYDTTDMVNPAARVQLGAWTKLTISYDATTGLMALYVNGTLASTGMHTSKIPAVGSLVLGRYKYQSNGNNWYNGSISNVVVYPYSTNPGSQSTTLVSGANTGSCIDDSTFGSAPGTKVQIWGCNGTGAQQWSTFEDGSLRVSSIPGMCVDATGGGQVNGTKLQLWGCASGAYNQIWLPRADGSFLNPQSGRCLDLPNADVTNGNQLELFDCNGTPAQRWGTRSIS